MWKKKPPKEFVEVRGKVDRFGMRPFSEMCQGYRVLLEGSAIPYIVRVNPYSDKDTFVELTQPGDEVSFTVQKGYLDGTNFRNHSLPASLKPYIEN